MNSCDTAGDMHRDGFAGTTDPARSAPQYAKACDAGFAPSCDALSQLYAAGSGVTKNAAKARQLHARACRLSDRPGVDLPLIIANARLTARCIEILRAMPLPAMSYAVP